MFFFFEILRLGLSSLMLHKLRSFLTMLGIIGGVFAVIVMAAIGEGSKRKALADIRDLGARNIIIRSVKPDDTSFSGSGSRNLVLAYGVSRQDVRRIRETIGPIERMVSLKNVGSRVSHQGEVGPAEVFGTYPELLEVTSLHVERGRYLSPEDEEDIVNVAVIGAAVAERLFPLDDPLSSWIRVHNYRNVQPFRVVGVLRPVGLAGGAGSALVGRDLNFDVHIPMSAAEKLFGDLIVRRQSGSFEGSRVELSEVYIQVPEEDEDDVMSVASQVKLLIDQKHARDGDVTTIVPLELLEQAERTQRMFNFLMIAIASVSLLVGGIGIMNIMLASVTERTREIGIRRALGATRPHIVSQFLVETTVLSGLGGLTGVVLGLAAVAVLMGLRDTFEGLAPPHVTAWSIIVSVVVATVVGVVFGLYPAIQAARQDPIVALRHD